MKGAVADSALALEALSPRGSHQRIGPARRNRPVRRKASRAFIRPWPNPPARCSICGWGASGAVPRCWRSFRLRPEVVLRVARDTDGGPGPTVVLSVIVPAFNEGDRLFENLLLTATSLRGLTPSFEIVVVDDGSTDDTSSEAMRAAAQIGSVRVVTYEGNRGKGFALSRGVAESRGDLVAFLDADLELHPDQLGVLLEVLTHTHADLVIASKKLARSRYEFPIVRRILSELYLLCIRVLFRLPVSDTQTGMKLFRREVLRRALPAVRSTTFAFDLDLLVNVHRLGFRIAEAPVTVKFLRKASRLTVRDVWRIGTDTLRLYSRVQAARWPFVRLRRPETAEDGRAGSAAAAPPAE